MAIQKTNALWFGAWGLALAGCQGGTANLPGDANDHSPWNEITAQEVIYFTGTEPFWGGQIGPDGMVYKTPDLPDGVRFAVKRFAGRGGVSFNGEMGGNGNTKGKQTTIAITPGACSDGMSDTFYPLNVTLEIEGSSQRGCGWTDRQPRTGGE